MAFIRRRITKTGVVSTALVESYRGSDGKPRHRLIANLHGAETLTAALGRLAALRDRLRNERVGLESERPDAEKFYETVTLDTLHGRVWSAAEGKEIDPLMKARKRLLKRLAEIETELALIQKEGVAIKKHCTASADEIRAEVAEYAKHFEEAEALELGLKLGKKGLRRILRDFSPLDDLGKNLHALVKRLK